MAIKLKDNKKLLIEVMTLNIELEKEMSKLPTIKENLKEMGASL